MKANYLKILSALMLLFIVSCQSGDSEQANDMVVFDQLDPKLSADFYLNAMFIENDLDALKLMTHPDQKTDFSRSIGSLATMLVRMDSATYEITSFEQKENLALIKFNLSMTSDGKVEERKELMTLEQIDSKWYVQ